MKNNNYIYVILVSSHTLLGRIIRKFSKYEYTHIAVALNSKLSDFITFSRRKHFSLFDAGFMHERLNYYNYGRYEKVKLKVFKIPVSYKK